MPSLSALAMDSDSEAKLSVKLQVEEPPFQFKLGCHPVPVAIQLLPVRVAGGRTCSTNGGSAPARPGRAFVPHTQAPKPSLSCDLAAGSATGTATGSTSGPGTNSVQVTRSVQGRLPILASWVASVVHIGLAVFVYQTLVSQCGVHALCPDGSWTLFLDSFDTEGNVNSCVKHVTASITWSGANSVCIALGSGSHLLTSQQVSQSDGDQRVPTPI